ncbi:PHP domain-containing protein, partial [uncultured Lentibacter sp.]|uniref:PHP domain-containing protein n=1 Tax=uncultured Lentibacter sp. TaxID=1659309 RepID=UPI00260F1CEA
MNYAELCVTTNFTFLTGASHPEEMMARAVDLGLEAIAITDRNSLAGVVRAYSALKVLRKERPENAALPKLIIGCRLVLRDSAVQWLALPTDRAAYQRLTRLLSLGKQRAKKGDCHLDQSDLVAHGAGMILIALPPALSGAQQDIAP